jgi:hypothetical protein
MFVVWHESETVRLIAYGVPFGLKSVVLVVNAFQNSVTPQEENPDDGPCERITPTLTRIDRARMGLCSQNPICPA